MNKKKIILITIILGLIFQFIGTLVYSYTAKKSSSWKPLHIERCRVNLCGEWNANGEWNNDCQPSTVCTKILIFGTPPYYFYNYEDEYKSMQWFNYKSVLQNIILWHGLALLIVLGISKKRRINQI
jgi:hypothetical protein